MSNRRSGSWYVSHHPSWHPLTVGRSDEEKLISDGPSQARSCKPTNRISLSITPLHLDEDRLFEAATDYRSWTFGRYTLKNLPAFDSSASFGITAEDENDSIKHEIKKLVQFISSKKPPLFDSYGALGETNAAGFEDLFSIVDQIRSNLHIIMHDNASLALDRYVDKTFYGALKQHRSQLRRRYLGDPLGINGHIPKTLSDEIKNAQAYSALIDFIFHSLAWWLAHVTVSKSWHTPIIIAVLARWSVKLKFIALDPVRWAEQALCRGEEIMRRIANEQSDTDRITVEFAPGPSETQETRIHFPEDRDLDYQYYSLKLELRKGIHRFINRILSNLIAKKSSTDKSTAFEVRTFIYNGNLDKTLRQLTVQQDGRIETSSDLTNLRRSYCALQLLLSNARSISPSNENESFPETARIHWSCKFRRSDPDLGSVSTTRLDDVISVLVPLSFMGSSHLVNYLENPLILLDSDSDSEYPLAVFDLSPEESPKIEFSLSTRRNRNRNLPRIDSHMILTSKSPLIPSLEGKSHLVFAAASDDKTK